ncbi:MAG: zinc ribbon domain-containing protein [Gammaproteobacteria bacterium]
MSLIKCPECNEEVSEQAPACPHCGKPKPADKFAGASPQQMQFVRRRIEKAEVFQGIGGLLIAIGFGIWVFSDVESVGWAFVVTGGIVYGIGYMLRP